MIINSYSLRTTIALTFLLITSSSHSMDRQQLEKNIAHLLSTPTISIQEQLQGGLTNTTLLATNQKDSFVVRLGKQNPENLGINRYCEEACQKNASQAGIAPTIMYSNPQNGTLIRSFITGNALTKDDMRNPVYLKSIIEVLKKCHQILYQKELETCSIYEKVRTMLSLSSSYQPSFLSTEEMEKTKTTINTIETHFQGKETMYAGLCHCDVLPENFIDDGKQLWLIDWEYASWGNILFDLTSLCCESAFNEQETITVLKLYFGQSWQEHYDDFIVMRAIYNLRNALWFDLRGKEIAVMGDFNMADLAKKFFDLFKQDAAMIVPFCGDFIKEK